MWLARGSTKGAGQAAIPLTYYSGSTVVVFPIPRMACRNCGVVRHVKVNFADVRRSYTKAFERYALELCQHMTILEETILPAQDGRWTLGCLAIEVFTLGLPDRFIATSLELAGEGDAVGCVGDGRDLPLGGLADPRQDLGILGNCIVVFKRETFEHVF